MKIYKSEKGLTDVIRASLSSSIVVDFNHSDEQVDLFKRSLASLETEERIKTDLSKVIDDPHPDLLYGSAILVSANMNLNDDIFVQEELWAARNTPVGTPYNVEHESTDIIGHIFASRAVDNDGNTLEDMPVDDTFHIEVSFAMYKFIFPDLAESIISKAEAGEQAVSMECILEDFDYGIIDSKGTLNIVARNEETAFLTKKLRVYGGTGNYQGNKIGRVLKSIRFVGMGTVATPANPNSEYLQFLVSAKNKFNLYKDLEELDKTNAFLYKDERGKAMTIKTIEEAQVIIEELEAKVSDKEASVSELAEKTETLEAEKKELEKSVSELTSNLEAETTKVGAAQQKFDEVKASLEEKDAKYDELEKSHTEATEKLEKIEKEKTLADRLAKLEELGVKDQDPEKIGNMDEATFASTVSFVESLEISQATEQVEQESTEEVDAETQASETLDNVEENQEQEDNQEALAQAGSNEDNTDEDEEVDLTALASLLKAKQNPTRGILNK